MTIYIFIITLIVSPVFIKLYAQNKTYEIQIKDVNSEECLIDYLIINDSITVLPNTQNNNTFFINLPESTCKIIGAIGCDTLINTTINLNKDNTITLFTDNIKDFWQKEYQEDFSKIYSNKGETPIIGLKKDGTFLFKRFIHISYAAYFLYETGNYSMLGNTLILSVNSYYHTRQSLNLNKVLYQYSFILKDDKIIDINKYGMNIGDK